MNEPQNTHDESKPRRATGLDARLRAEEPPVSDEDTNPNRRTALDQWLADNEPPFTADDTHPSQVARPVALADRGRSGGGRVLQVVAVLLLVSAFLLLALAAYVWGDVDHSDASQTPDDVVNNDAISVDGIPERAVTDPQQAQATATRTAAAPDDAAPNSVSEVAPVAATQVPPPFDGADAIFPTAAADEIAAALLTPAAVDPPRESVVRQPVPFTIKRSTGRAQVVHYTVKDGDSIESIAESFDLDDYYTIIWSNKSSDYNPLRPGVQLNILPEDGVYHEVTENITIDELAEQYEVDPYTIIDTEYNDLFGSTPETLLVKGMWVGIPGAEAERELFLPQRAGSTEGGGGAGGISGSYTLWGCTANVQGGSMPYGRPLTYYTWMRGYVPGGHTGVDIAANPGDPIAAAGAGTVVYAGWNNGGYGNVVVIAHGPVFTIYGHMTRTGVSCGQQVAAGEVVGTVGNTGNSSGPHLHFEVRDANFTALNPQNWVSF